MDSASSRQLRPLLATRLNGEPPIYRGCTSSELMGILIACLCVWGPIGLLAGWLVFDATAFGLGVAVVGAVASFLCLTSVFRQLKRGKPEGYYVQRLARTAGALGVYRHGAVTRTGVWRLGRSLPRRIASSRRAGGVR